LLHPRPVAIAEEAASSIDKELKIMSKVLEASLDASNIQEWHGYGIGYSAFESKVKSEYIPTVGAIFSINVNFPIVKPDEKPEEAKTGSSQADDLWEQMSNPQQEEWKFEQPQEIFGIGIMIGKDGENVVVKDTFDNSPASVAGISEGDVILEVEGRRVADMEFRDVGDRIQGPEGSQVLITYRDVSGSGVDDEEVEVVLERERIRLNRPRTPKIPRINFGNPDQYLIKEEGFSGNRVRNRYRTQILGDRNISISGIYSQDIEYDAAKVDLLRSTLMNAMARYGHRLSEVPDFERVLIRIKAPRMLGQKTIILDGSGELKIPILSGTHTSESDQLLLSFDKKDLVKGTTREKLERKVSPIAY
jgi:hypothetical protein